MNLSSPRFSSTYRLINFPESTPQPVEALLSAQGIEAEYRIVGDYSTFQQVDTPYNLYISVENKDDERLEKTLAEGGFSPVKIANWDIDLQACDVLWPHNLNAFET